MYKLLIEDLERVKENNGNIVLILYGDGKIKYIGCDHDGDIKDSTLRDSVINNLLDGVKR